MIPNQVRICSGLLYPLCLLRWEGVGNGKYGWGKGDMVGMEGMDGEWGIWMGVGVVDMDGGWR